MEMLDSTNDYKDNCVELISPDKTNTHVRVSSEFLKDESESSIKDQVKRDIIYVTFQTFAETDLDKITVTAIPIVRSSFNPNDTYDGRLNESLKQTVTTTRTDGMEILKKYLGTSSFKDLYSLDGTIYLPNDNFDKLKFEELDKVFSDLNK